MNKIEQYVDADEYTGYGIHTVLNRILREAGLKEVKPQQMYNYLRNGLIVRGEKIHGAALRPIKKAEVQAFLRRYCLRNEIEIEIKDPEVSEDQMELFEV